ncbi:MAG: hypothetical protein IKW35_03660 [Paludibacteraceae bacterium]|nr:hypothetical protein [Paludibacteraceae bacterium]
MTKQEAAIKYITENYLDYSRLRHDVIADKLQVRMENGWREMTKHDINSIVCHAAQEYDANITSREVMTALQSDLIPDVHPLREYVLSCREWTEEQPDWIDFVASQVRVKASPESATDRPKGLSERTSCCQTTTLLDRPYGADRPMNLTGEADLTVSEANGLASNSSQCERSNADALWRQCFKKWFVAMVASWMKDEVVNHQVLVLIGKQGIFKTTWLEHLIPPHLRAYACKLANSNDLNKDERLRIAEFGLISLDEIDSMNNRELNQLKSVITATDVNERAAYAYTKERRVRLASFCASGNRRDFLTDITGNRRWLPFEVESIQNPFYTILPYERMYAQAWALAQDPLFSYWFDLEEIDVLEKHNQHFRDESNEEQLLDVYFAVPAEGVSNTKFLTTAEISERLIYYGNIKRPLSLSRLGVLLSQKGFLSIRKGSPQRRGWIVYERDNEEINAERRILSKT